MQNLQDIYDHIDEHKDEYIEDLLRLVRQPSISARSEGIEEMAALTARYLQEAGMTARIDDTPGHPVVYGESDVGAPRTLLIYNHYDVVPPEPLEAWTSPPFDPVVRDGYVFGRGTTDNKGNIVSRVAAMKAWQRVRGSLPINIKYIIEGEEEISSPNLGDWLEAHKEELEADGCLWEDTVGRVDVPLVSLGNKGMCVIQLRCRTMPSDVHSGLAAALPNAGWRLIQALATMRDKDGRVLVPGFYDRVLPLDEDHQALLEKLPPVSVWREAGIQLPGNLSDKEVAQVQSISPTFNLSGISAGYTGPGARGAVLATAEAKLDIRLVPDQDPEEIPDLIRKHLEAHGFGDIEVEPTSSPKRASRSKVRTLLNRAITEASRELYGADPIFEPNQGGCTPMVLVHDILEMPLSAMGVGHVTARTHGADENIKVDHLIDGIKFFVTLFDRFARTEHPA